MKIGIYFREEPRGSIESSGEEIRCEGDVKDLVDFYGRQGYKGEALLRRILERLQGNWWAEEVKENA